MSKEEEFKISNKPTTIQVSKKVQGLCMATKKYFKLHSLEETVFLSLKLMCWMKGKYPGFGKGELWQIAGFSTKDFELTVQVQADVGVPFKEGFGDFPFNGVERKKKKVKTDD